MSVAPPLTWRSQRRGDEVFVGYGVSDNLESLARQFKTLRVGQSVQVEGRDWRLPLFISRVEAEEKKCFIDDIGQAIPPSTLF